MCSLLEVCPVEGNSELYKITSKQLDELVDELERWAPGQPHLPQVSMPKQMLRNILIRAKYSLGKAKESLDLYYTMRNVMPEVFKDRDPRGSSMIRGYRSGRVVCLPHLTPEKRRVMIFNLRSDDSKEFHLWDYVKYAVAIAEIRIREDSAPSDVYVYDMAKLGIAHITKVSPADLKKIEFLFVKALAARYTHIHFVNAPPIIDRILALLKVTLNPKLMKKLHVCMAGNIEKLYEFIPQSILPSDYGGCETSMDDLAEVWNQEIDKRRDWYIEQETITVDERLRPGPSVNLDDLYGLPGSFRTLNVD